MGRRKVRRRIRDDENRSRHLEILKFEAEAVYQEEHLQGNLELWLGRHNHPRNWAALGCGVLIYTFLFIVWRFANL